jgi:hypothetical protein
MKRGTTMNPNGFRRIALAQGCLTAASPEDTRPTPDWAPDRAPDRAPDWAGRDPRASRSERREWFADRRQQTGTARDET